jgi:hypothetical protein
MTSLYYGDMLPPRRLRSHRSAPDGVLVGTASPVRLRVEPIDHHLTPDGTVCIATMLDDRLISRCAVPEETAEDFLSMELFEQPVALALNVRRVDPGLEGNLLALVPLSDTTASQEGEDPEPWKGSVPGAGYEQAAGGSSGSPGNDGEGQLVGVFLGQVVRFEEDRKHPDNLLREAADMLAGVVRGRIGNVVDRLIHELQEPES